jgi:hypothetical protein
MDYAWTVYIRDVFVILAAVALVLVCLYLSLVGWQIYKIAAGLGVELEPIVTSLQSSASTVENTTNFLSGRFTSPTQAATNSALGLFGLYQLYREARRQQKEPVASIRGLPPATPAGASTEEPKG